MINIERVFIVLDMLCCSGININFSATNIVSTFCIKTKYDVYNTYNFSSFQTEPAILLLSLMDVRVQIA